MGRSILKSNRRKNTIFIPATEDWCGKELFENREVREGFLSDMLKIPRSAIKETRIVNPNLWKRGSKEKQGIVDIRILLNNERVINIEIQVIPRKHWDKRQLFYLSKMYTENARRGEDYDNLPDCISIAILDFSIIDDEEYYHCYKLRDEQGKIFSNAISVYILELDKKLGREEELDDWVRLLRAKSEEELDLIKTKNKSILAAIKELKTIGLTNVLRYEYEYRLKVKRDARARDAYVRDEGIVIGKQESIYELLGGKELIPVDIKEIIDKEKDSKTLGRWIRMAANVEGVEEFISKM